MSRYHEVLGSPEAPYPFDLKAEKGSQWHMRPPWPDVVVLSNTTVRVREMQWQRLVVRASAPESNKSEDVQVMRLVAVLEGDQEIEMSRIALPAEVDGDEPTDPTKCAVCGRGIPAGSGVEINGHWYHVLTCTCESGG